MPLVRPYNGTKFIGTLNRVVALHPYNRELIVANRWCVPYAPAYGWRSWLRREHERR